MTRTAARQAAKGGSLFSLAAVCVLLAALAGGAPAEASRHVPSSLSPALEPSQASLEQVLGASSAPRQADALPLYTFVDVVSLAHASTLAADQVEAVVVRQRHRLHLTSSGLARPPDLAWELKTATGPPTSLSEDKRLEGRDLGRESLRLSFQGLWTDPVTGIAYARNRWYDPRTASWLSEDPLGAVDSPNMYAFVGWGPHVRTDPMGWNMVPESDLPPCTGVPYAHCAPADGSPVAPPMPSFSESVREELAVNEAVQRQHGLTIDGRRAMTTMGPAVPVNNDAVVSTIDPATIPSSDWQAGYWWFQDYTHGASQQLFASAAGVPYEPENEAARAGALSTVVGEAGVATIVVKRAVTRMTTGPSNAAVNLGRASEEGEQRTSAAHHTIPQYMGGRSNQQEVDLGGSTHSSFHEFLDNWRLPEGMGPRNHAPRSFGGEVRPWGRENAYLVEFAAESRTNREYIVNQLKQSYREFGIYFEVSEVFEAEARVFLEGDGQ